MAFARTCVLPVLEVYTWCPSFVDHLNIVIHRFYLEGRQVDEIQGANIAKVYIYIYIYI